MKKISLTSALTCGVLNVVKLEDNNHVFILNFTEKSLLIPVVEGVPYCASDMASDQQEIFNILFKDFKLNGASKDENLRMMSTEIRFTKDIPDHSKIVEKVSPIEGMKFNNMSLKILKESGYEIKIRLHEEAELRDWSELLAKNEAARSALESMKKKTKHYRVENIDPDIIRMFESVLIKQSSKRGIFFTGDPGNGKSTLFLILCSLYNIPGKSIPITPDMLAEDLMGCYKPRTGATTNIEDKVAEIQRNPEIGFEEAMAKVKVAIKEAGEQGQWEFIPGPLLEACNEGWAICFEEFGYLNSAATICLNAVLDGSEFIFVNGKSYRKNENFIIFATSNPGARGQNLIPDSLINRFINIPVPNLTKGQFVDRLINECEQKPYFVHMPDKEFAEKLFDFMQKYNDPKIIAKWSDKSKLSIRNAISLCDRIYLQKLTFEQFKTDVFNEYFGCRNVNYDNTSLFFDKKENDEIINSDIMELYKLYEFETIEESEGALYSFDSLLIETEKPKTTVAMSKSAIASAFTKTKKGETK